MDILSGIEQKQHFTLDAIYHILISLFRLEIAVQLSWCPEISAEYLMLNINSCYNTSWIYFSYWPDNSISCMGLLSEM